MSSSRPVGPKTVSDEIPAVPLTIEGYSVLHQMMRVRWAAWRPMAAAEKRAILEEASGVLGAMEQNASGQSALFSVLGHKGDLMFIHFRKSFDELNAAELQLSQMRLGDFLEPTTSYLSVIELGLYESTIKAYRDLKERGLEASAVVSGDAEASLRFVLSDGPATGRSHELVHAAHRGASAADE
jgi:hydrogen peroxide-dependent heme synthase